MKTDDYGPTLPISREIHAMKYRAPEETFRESTARVAGALADNSEHYRRFKELLRDMRYLPGGRVQAAVGAPSRVTPYNCFVSGTIEDSMPGIMRALTEAAETLRLGGGIGYDFSTIRPKGDLIMSLSSAASGPVSFMQLFDALCKTVSSAGQRRGAQMAVLRVDHPDIETFIAAKQDGTSLTAFNLSVAVTDEFMDAVCGGAPFTLRFGSKMYKTVDARALWDKIMRSTWDWGEPGVLFIDRINNGNPAQYCEDIAATNPCGEQPLPPYGACLLGSYNLVKYIKPVASPCSHEFYFDYDQLAQDVPPVVRAMDNIIDTAVYPDSKQSMSALSMRRMGLGVTGLANAGEALGLRYGSPEFLAWQREVHRTLAVNAYSASADLAAEKGPFPSWDAEKYGEGCEVFSQLPEEIKEKVRLQGLRNSHLLSFAPCGTISLFADNVSSGIEPPFSHFFDRVIQTDEGPRVERVEDYAYRVWGIEGKTADECTVDDHLNVLLEASKWVDSAVSKTCNVGDDVSWENFKHIYMRAWVGKAKGITTFRAAGKRMGILTKVEGDEPQACFIDERGNKTCE